MKIESAQFIRGVTGTNDILENGIPQIAFIGRSNAGKSSVINSLANREIARTSSFPGLTQQINLFLINGVFYLVDLPGYGYAKTFQKKREKLKALINWYFFVSNNEQRKVVVIIDADVGPTKDDLEMIYSLEDHGKNIIIVANKIDKIKKSEYEEQFIKIKELIGAHKIIPYSAKKKIGVNDLLKEILC